ncbi:MAG: 5'/3'-nucleotidase SurE [Cytophagaceae bacterium]|jgi:5'-nucleotidase|nr:5'/3'-nucleotidase SurE [Cytophagaceae bacterium]
MATKPLILVTNDDGIFSPGIRMLVEVMQEIGEVVVVAPDSPQSGMGHAITIGNTIRLEKSKLFPEIEAYECSGTPADCVKIAKHFVLKNRVPHLVVSGINHGSNSSISVLYSGTMSAAIEAALEGLPAIGFSLCDYDHNADFQYIRSWVKQITETALTKGIPTGITLNVNFPSRKYAPLKGIKFCRQAIARWEERFEERYDPYGRRYFWMAGDFDNKDVGEDTDEWALSNGYISIVPCTYDLTAHTSIGWLNRQWSYPS